MSEWLHLAVERYGLIAVFAGCMAEGESIAILAGFLAHQRFFAPWDSLLAAFSGAFLGDLLLFLLGRRFAGHRFVERLRRRPGFSQVLETIRRRPAASVILLRYAYGFRLVGGVATGLSGITTSKFMLFNGLSAVIWAAIFWTVGYVFGLGLEKVLDTALRRHERLIVALVLGLGAAVVACIIAHRRRRAMDAASNTAPLPLLGGHGDTRP